MNQAFQHIASQPVATIVVVAIMTIGGIAMTYITKMPAGSSHR